MADRPEDEVATFVNVAFLGLPGVSIAFPVITMWHKAVDARYDVARWMHAQS